MHATECEDRTPRRTHRTRGAHSYFSHTNVTRDQRTYVGSNMRGIAPCLSKVIFSSSMFHGTLLDPHMSPHFSTPFSTQFSTPFPAPTPLLNTSMIRSPCATPQGGLILGRLAEPSPLTNNGRGSKGQEESTSRTTHSTSCPPETPEGIVPKSK